MDHYIDIGGESLAYIKKGSGPDVLVLHGNRSSSRAMLPLIDELATELRVFAPDMCGFGRSSYNRRHREVKDYAEDMVVFLEAMDMKEVTIIGWSFGGIVAMELAKLSHRVKKMALLSSVGPEGIVFPAVTTSGEKSPLSNRGESKREKIRAMLGRDLFDGELPQEYLHLIEEALLQRNGLDAYRAMRRYRLKDARNIPVLILHGAEDRVVALDDALAMESFYPDCALRVLEGGHFLLYNRCKEVADEILKFLHKK